MVDKYSPLIQSKTFWKAPNAGAAATDEYLRKFQEAIGVWIREYLKPKYEELTQTVGFKAFRTRIERSAKGVMAELDRRRGLGRK